MEFDLNQRKRRFWKSFVRIALVPTLEIERLILRAWRRSDLDPMLHIMRIPRLQGLSATRMICVRSIRARADPPPVGSQYQVAMGRTSRLCRAAILAREKSRRELRP